MPLIIYIKNNGFHSGSVSGIRDDAGSGRKSSNESEAKLAFEKRKFGSSQKQKLSGIIGNFDKRRRENHIGSLETSKLLDPKSVSLRLGAFVETPVSGSQQPTASTGLKMLSKVQLLLHSKKTSNKNPKTDGKKSFRSNAPSDALSNYQPKSSSKQYDIDEYDTRERFAAEAPPSSHNYIQMEGQGGEPPNYFSESFVLPEKEARYSKEQSVDALKKSQLYLRAQYPKNSGAKAEPENIKESLASLVIRLKSMIESRDSTIQDLLNQNQSLQKRLEQKSQEAEYLKVRLSILHNK